MRAGSTVTQMRRLAEVFAHKPSLVCMEDDGDIRHDGRLLGYLYVVAEAVSSADVYSHPKTSMAPGCEWLTTRDLAVTLIGQVEVAADEALTEAQVADFRRAHSGRL